MKYNEVAAVDHMVGFKSVRKGEIIRENVQLTEREARTLNGLFNESQATPGRPVHKTIYVKVEEPKAEPVTTDERKELFASAKELGINVAKNITTEDLKAKIASHAK